MGEEEGFVPEVIWSPSRRIFGASLPMVEFPRGSRGWTGDLQSSSDLSHGWCLCTENKCCFPTQQVHKQYHSTSAAVL